MRKRSCFMIGSAAIAALLAVCCAAGGEETTATSCAAHSIAAALSDNVVSSTVTCEGIVQDARIVYGKQGKSVRQERQKWVEKCLTDFGSIKPLMTRTEVAKVLQIDGGLQSPVTMRYHHPECFYFKIDVTFSVKTNPADQGRVVPTRDDRVISVSKPYIEWALLD